MGNELIEDTLFVSVARLLDQARELIVEAWDNDERPEYLLVHPSLYRAVMEAKRRESYGGRTIRLLGLALLSSEATPVEAPKIL